MPARASAPQSSRGALPHVSFLPQWATAHPPPSTLQAGAPTAALLFFCYDVSIAALSLVFRKDHLDGHATPINRSGRFFATTRPPLRSRWPLKKESPECRRDAGNACPFCGLQRNASTSSRACGSPTSPAAEDANFNRRGATICCSPRSPAGHAIWT